MTCQELLALGAINAALPTGQIALDTILDSLSKGISNRPKNGEDIYLQLPDDDFSCCQDLWQSDNEYKNTKRSRLYVMVCTIFKAVFRVFSCSRRYVIFLLSSLKDLPVLPGVIQVTLCFILCLYFLLTIKVLVNSAKLQYKHA